MSKRPIVILAVAVITACAWVMAASDKPVGTRPAHPRAGAGPRGRPGRPARLTKEQEEELLAFLAKQRPEYYEHLLELREENPPRYKWAMLGMWRWYKRVQDMPEAERKAYLKVQESRIKALRIVRAIRGEKDQQKVAKLKQQLRQTAAERFEADQVLFEARLVRLEQRVKRLREDLKDRKQRRNEIIDEQVKKMLEAKPGGARGRRRYRPPSDAAPPKAPKGKDAS